MNKRFSFLFFLFLLISVTGLWARSIPDELQQGSPSSLRRELLEALDRLVAYETYYRSVYGRFTKILNRVGITIPRTVAQVYEIHVMEASADRLLVLAYSESDGKTVDQVSINQDFEVRANFKEPLPRPEFLRAQATRELRLLRDAMPGEEKEERAVFKDYFRFDVRKDSEERRVAFAVGIRPPVVGMQLEYGPTQVADHAQAEGLALPMDVDLTELSEAGGALLGQGEGSDVMSSGEEAHLAQKIFHGEMGHYAKTLSELSRIANFQFEVNVEDKPPDVTRQISSSKGDLEFEPVGPPSKN